MILCNSCKKPMTKKHTKLIFNREGLGEYEVPGVLHFACEDCGDKLIFPDESERITKVGIKKHVITLLSSTKNDVNILDLKSKIVCDVDLLEKAIKELEKEKIIILDNEQPIPVIILLNKKSNNIVTKIIKKLFKGE